MGITENQDRQPPERSDIRLTDLVDIDTLQALQDDFAALIGAAASIRGPDGGPVTEPAGESEFCQLMQSTASGRAACETSHADAVDTAARDGRICAHKCHAALGLCAAPIQLDDQLLGAIIVGNRPFDAVADQDGVSDLAAQHGIDEDTLATARAKMHKWTPRAQADAASLARQLANIIGQLCHQSHQLRQRVDELALIYDASSMLAGRSEVQEILDLSLARLLEVMRLRAASIRMLDEESGELRIVAVASMSEAYLNKGPLTVERSPIDMEALSGHSVYVADLPNDPRTVYKEDARREGLVSAVVTPLTCRGKTIGVLRAYTDHAYRFTPFDVALLEAMASQVAAAIVNARLRSEAREAERLDRQVRLAGEVQRRMMPARLPRSSRHAFGCVYEPASELCGDFYDLIEFPNGDIGLVVADVVGKGVPASLMMASARATLRSHAALGSDVAEVMTGVNQRLCHDTLISEFVSAFYGVLSADGSRMTYCSAGHEPAVLLRGGRIESLEPGGMLLGIEDDATFRQFDISLRSGDVLVAFTDGLTDALNYDEQAYGKERLHASILRHGDLPADQMARQLLWDVRRFVGLATATDDITLVVTRVV